ncbi:MAG: flagellar motor protein MotB [Rhodobacteraceae bacterium]|nr:MAG: flagellar motor protein MotB [Paracoccaceae bacterium]
MAAAAEEPEVVEEEDEECPKCPPVGAPAWMATFADMATLLMAFFVLILSFAEFNVPKFKQISGSLKNAFGVQRIVPVVEQPKGTTVLSLNFSPSPTPSVSKEMTQQTTQIEQSKLELQQKDNDSEGADGNQSAEQVVKALEEAVARGDIEIETDGDELVVSVKSESAPSDEISELIKETQSALADLKENGEQPLDETALGGIEQQLAKIAEVLAESQGVGTETDSGSSNSEQQKKAEVSEDELRIALQEEIAQGLVEVERKDGKIFITVGAGGAFASGSADLTSQARDIMARVAEKGVGDTGKVTVSGHTDDVPLVFGSTYRDNWDLAAARASSVVQAMQAGGIVSADRLQAVSFGEAKPVADNQTAAGREKNRRIEIEIQF